jgi:hypothetical protein
MFVPEEAIISEGLAAASIVIAPALVLVATVTSAVRRYLALKEYGTIHLSRRELLTIKRRHEFLNALSHASTALYLLLGGLIIQLGYMSELDKLYLPYP